MTFRTPAALAVELGVKERTLRKLARDLGACRVIGKTMFFMEEDVAAIIARTTPKRLKEAALTKKQFEDEHALRQRLGLEPKPRPGVGNVYFICGGDFVKIGFARSVKDRLIDLQVSNPFRLEVLLSYRSSFKHERELHKRFAQYRSYGEWFRHEGELADYIILKRGDK